MPRSDDPDMVARQMEDDRRAQEQFKQDTQLNLNSDKFLDILKRHAQSTPGSDKLMNILEKNGMADEGDYAPVSRTASRGSGAVSMALPARNPLLEQGIRLSSNPVRLASQVQIIKTALKDLVAQHVCANTKAQSNLASKVYTTGDGMKVVYEVDGQKVSVTASGAFGGDEAIILQPKDGSVVGLVARERNGQYVDVSSEYKIELALVE